MSDMPHSSRPDFDDVVRAGEQIAAHVVCTPLLRSDRLDAATGASVFLKAENLQRMGAFKFRGAYNAVSRLTAEEKAGGVLASSSGNHAQGIAEAARLVGADATIVMPSDAPKVKVAGVRRAGASIRFYDRNTQDREQVASALREEIGGTFVHPFDHPHIIAGQGTAGDEAMRQMADAGQQVDVVVVPCGGGGLTAGVALAVHAHFPSAEIYAVEPAGYDDTARSFRAGERMRNAKTSGSICDSLLSPSPGEITFAINAQHLNDVVTVTDDEVRSAVAFLFDALKTVVEPGGAAALAAVLFGRVASEGKNVVVLLSGGNVDPDVFADIVARPHGIDA
ncbi:MAG: threonine/serine dehydratase [Pseudomonadota bacterium]